MKSLTFTKKSVDHKNSMPKANLSFAPRYWDDQGSTEYGKGATRVDLGSTKRLP